MFIKAYPSIVRPTYLKCRFLLISLVFILCRCTTTKPVAYFSQFPKDTSINTTISKEIESVIQKNDILSITISSLNKEMDEKFNTAAKVINANILMSANNVGYQVNELGEITMHYLGTIKVEGMTRRALGTKLQKDLLPYFNDPILSVQYLNRKITVMGEVAGPKIINLPNERISFIDAVVSAGDLSDVADYKNIIIIRDSGTTKYIKHINLEDSTVLSSEWAYVKADDVIYVGKNTEKVDKEERRRNLQTTISLVASMVSLVVIILNNLLK